MLELRNITKTFGKTTVVDNISITIGEGEFFCLLGPSGCGKTTLLRMIAGFETPTKGSIILNGLDITSLPAYKRDFNLVFQNFALFPHLSVYDNVAYGLKVKRVAASEIEEKVNQTLDSLGLQGFGKRLPSTLSGGQQQRVAVARAIINRPKILLLDEPLSSLDKKIAERTLMELTDLQKNLGISFLYVTHNQHEALSLADRIALINNGRISQLASPAELYEKPADRFTAGFIGKMNFLPAEVLSRDDNHYKIKILDSHTINFKSNGEFRLGNSSYFCLRPENISISTNPDQITGNSLPAVLKHRVYLGDSLDFEFVTEKGTPLHVKSHRHLGNGDLNSIIPGAQYFLKWEDSSGWIVSEN